MGIIQFFIDLFMVIAITWGMIGFIIIGLFVAVIFRAIGMDSARQKNT